MAASLAYLIEKQIFQTQLNMIQLFTVQPAKILKAKQKKKKLILSSR